ncbi:MAG: hypothetical protein LBT80_01175 [Lactobacillaceae bacterium]|jgi:glutamate--cysteine ligase|nr:hypothetical protein [Lactobacillaceae bacterium]
MKLNYSEVGRVLRRHNMTRQATQLFLGVEIESHRVDRLTGGISQAPYPADLSDQKQHLFIKNDYGQAQPEIITPKMVSVNDTLELLAAVNDTLRKSMTDDESLWLYSMPPKLSTDRHEFKMAEMTPEKIKYMIAVSKRRDLAKSIQSGIHINIGLELDILHYIYAQHFQTQYANQRDFANDLYMKIAQGLMHYRWLFTLLFGATPFADASFFSEGQPPKQPVRSIRSSVFGFGNGIYGSYQNVEAYIAKIEADVAAQDLIAEREFYDVVRLKGPAKLKELATKGVYYIELRTFDNNPLTQTGINEKMIQFTELFFVYLMMTEPVFGEGASDVDKQLLASRAKNEQVALENPLQPSSYQKEALDILDTLAEFTYDNHFKAYWISSLKRQLTNPVESIAAQLVGKANTDFYDAMLRDSNERQCTNRQLACLAGFADLDQATQQVLRKQIQLGEAFQVVDRKAGKFNLERAGKQYLLVDGKLIPRD